MKEMNRMRLTMDLVALGACVAFIMAVLIVVYMARLAMGA
jgi:hypothetical protein